MWDARRSSWNQTSLAFELNVTGWLETLSLSWSVLSVVSLHLLCPHFTTFTEERRSRCFSANENVGRFFCLEQLAFLPLGTKLYFPFICHDANALFVSRASATDSTPDTGPQGWDDDFFFCVQHSVLWLRLHFTHIKGTITAKESISFDSYLRIPFRNATLVESIRAQKGDVL